MGRRLAQSAAELSAESVWSDAERPRGSLDVSVTERDRPPDVFALEVPASGNERRDLLAPVEDPTGELDREMLALDLASVREDHRVLDHAPELAHVPGEVVRLEGAPGARRNSGGDETGRREALEEVVHQEGEVRLSFSERWDDEVDRLQQEVEVLPEAPAATRARRSWWVAASKRTERAFE